MSPVLVLVGGVVSPVVLGMPPLFASVLLLSQLKVSQFSVSQLSVSPLSISPLCVLSPLPISVPLPMSVISPTGVTVGEDPPNSKGYMVLRTKNTVAPSATNRRTKRRIFVPFVFFSSRGVAAPLACTVFCIGGGGV